MCSMSSRANGLSAPIGSASRYASSSSAFPGRMRAKVVSAYALPRRLPCSEMRLSIGQEAFPRGLELVRAQPLGLTPQHAEALAYGERVVDHARGLVGVRAVVRPALHAVAPDP